MLREILLLCLAAGVCALDTTVAWQLMLSQPLVSGTLAGFLVGAPETGVFIGLVLQLLWSGSMPLGARPMPDAPVGTVSGVWFAAVLLEGGGTVSTSFSHLAGLLAALSIALAGRWTIMLERELNRRFVERFRLRLASDRPVNPDKAQLFSVMIAFLRGFLLCVAAIGLLAVAALPLITASTIAQRDYNLIVLVVGGLAVGVLFPVFVRRTKGRLPAFAGGVALALLIRSLSG